MEFAELVKESLDKNELEEASTLLYSVENIQLIGDASWDLTRILCEFITKSDEENIVNFVQNAAMYLCQLFGNPKELFLVFLEHAENFFSSEKKYFLLTDLLQVLLLRLSPRFIFYSLELALNQLTKLIKKKSIELENESTEDSEQELVSITNKFVEFLEVFILKDQEDETYNLKSILTYSLINLFESFLSLDILMDDNMNFKVNEKSTLEQKNSSYNLVRKIFIILSNMGNKNFFKFAQELEMRCLINDQNETLKLNKNALCSFVSYAFTYDFYMDKPHSPRIYQDFFLMKSFLPIINFLLSQPKNNTCLQKGLYTLKYFVEKNEKMTLNGNLLELMSIVQTFQLLFRVAVYSEKEDLRKESVEILKSFYLKFDRAGRYTFLNYYLNDNSNDVTLNNYVSSYLVYLFKEELSNSLDENEMFYKKDHKNFTRLFRLIVKMKNGNKTDLIQESSKINATLNMLRFLLLRDKENETAIIQMLRESKFLEELEESIKFGKENYEVQKKNFVGIQKNDSSMKFEATTGSGEKINEPTTDDKIKSCVDALQSLDVLESLRCRVVEFLEV